MKKFLITFFMALSLVTQVYASTAAAPSSTPSTNREKREVIIEGDIARYKTYEKLYFLTRIRLNIASPGGRSACIPLKAKSALSWCHRLGGVGARFARTSRSG